MRRIPIRLKLASALALPLAALAVVSVLELAESTRWVNEVNRQADIARASIGPSGLLRTLQNERTWPAVELIGFTSVTVPVTGYDETRADTDRAITAFRQQMADADPAVQEAFRPALAGLDDLDAIRNDIDTNTAPRTTFNIGFADQVFERYTEVIQPFFTAAEKVSLAVDADAELRQGTELANTSSRVIEVLSVMLAYAITDSYLSDNGIDESMEISRISMLQAEFNDYATQLRTAAGPYEGIAERWFPAELTDNTNEQVNAGINTGRVNLDATMAAVNVPEEEGFLAYEDAVHEAVNERADELDASAYRQRLLFGGLGLTAFLATVTLTLLVSRSITRPLRSLTQQAKDMAERRLPSAVLEVLETPLGEDVSVPDISPIRVKTHDEVADVADALNTVQDSALDLAVEQAVLRRNIADSFTNLGRRNQNLLSRQLDFITQLEAHEADPDTLAALFRLDHLATRMRRNAESLLVLAGIGPPRRWAAPVAVIDVIRAAFGEVETYERATVRDVQPGLVMGAIAADLAHLIAELLENALTFSPPEEKVEVRGRRREDGGYTIAVVDAGYGMTEAELAQANRRLAGTESFTVAPSKYLGHYVAGNLAARHGIDIRLSPAPGQGITAVVALPPALLAPDDALSGTTPAGALHAGGAGRGGGTGVPSAGGAFAAGGPGGGVGPAGMPVSGGPAGALGPARATEQITALGQAGPAPYGAAPAPGAPDPYGAGAPAAPYPAAASWPPGAQAGGGPGGPAYPAASPQPPAGGAGMSWADALAPLTDAAASHPPPRPSAPPGWGLGARPAAATGLTPRPPATAAPDVATVAGGVPAGPGGAASPSNWPPVDGAPAAGAGGSAYGRHRDYRTAGGPAADPAGAGEPSWGVGAPAPPGAGQPPVPFSAGSAPGGGQPPVPFSAGSPAPGVGQPPVQFSAGSPPPGAGQQAAWLGSPPPSGAQPPPGAGVGPGRSVWPEGGGAPAGPLGAGSPGGHAATPTRRAEPSGTPPGHEADPLAGVPSRPIWASLADLRTVRPATPAPATTADPRSGGTTAGGLTRRVSGAQLPTMQPRTIRRSPAPGQADAPAPASAPGPALPAPAAPAPAPAGAGPQGPAAGQAAVPPRSSADAEQTAGNVYDFLNRFTAGVQRGLDDAGADRARRS